MKTLRLLPLLLSLLLGLAACKKDKEPAPSKTALLTARAWKDGTESLRLNNVEGTRTSSGNDQSYLQFAADGKFTTGKVNNPSAPTSTGTWSFANNESQITLAFNGGASNTFELFEVSESRLVMGLSYNQTQIQQILAGNGGSSTATTYLPLLLLSAGAYTWPSGTPNINANQLTSVQWRSTAVPR